MTLGERQRLFTRNIGRLIEFAYAQGFEMTFGEAFRPPEQQALMVKAGKSKTLKSKHGERLAVDLNLFRDGVFLVDSEAHRPLGTFWKTLHPENSWGGDFKTLKDGNHYSVGEPRP